MFETSSDSPAPVRVVTEAIKDYVDRLSPIWIEGEISEINERSGGMAFMRLRDTSVDMSISVMCHRSVLSNVAPLPQNARVVMYAKASWYTKNGSVVAISMQKKMLLRMPNAGGHQLNLKFAK